MKKIITSIILSLFFLLSCNSSDENNYQEENPSDITRKPFSEGIVEMGIFSNDIDLGRLIDKIDFSKTDVKQQLEYLMENDSEAKEIFDIIENTGNQNPITAFAMTLNIAECNYFIKNDVVLGKARGFGWVMDNYHNQGEDLGTVYLETLVQTDQIADHDKQIYSSYKPSENDTSSSVNNIDFSLYNREIHSTKQNVLSYECDVIVYTPKNTGTNTPIQLHKLIVYTSPLFNNTINFTHPYYLEETSGILRLDIYLSDSSIPTLVMKPKAIREQNISAQELASRVASPVYGNNDLNWGFKALSIMMSGWGILGD